MKVVPVLEHKNKYVFDVKNMPPQMAATLIAAMDYDVETMRIDLVEFGPSTNTVMDRQQWAFRLGLIALDSTKQDEFLRVTECPCDTGGKCCQVEITLRVTNESMTQSLKVYTDDLVTSDPRVKPVHRTFSLKSISYSDSGLYVETLERHTFSDGDLVSILELPSARKAAPKWMRATKCSDDDLVLVPLFADEKVPDCENAFSTEIGTNVGKISNRQLLYILGPNQTVSFSGIARKGTGREWAKWSPTTRCFHRPLFRDNKINPNIKLTHQQAISLAKSCPLNVFDVEDTVISFARPDDCNACRQCLDWEKEHEVNGLVQLSKRKKPDWQRITVISNGSIEAKTIFQNAIAIVQERLLQISDSSGKQLMYPKLGDKK